MNRFRWHCYFFSTPEIPPSAIEKIRTSAFLTSGSLSSRSSDSSRARSRSIVASPPEAAPSTAEKRSRHRYERITPARFSRISVWRTASCSLAWPRSASTEVHRVANPSLSASDWISSSVLKSTRQIRKSGSDGRIIDIATSPITKHLDHDRRLRVDAPVTHPRQEFVHAVIPSNDPSLLRDDNPLSFIGVIDAAQKIVIAEHLVDTTATLDRESTGPECTSRARSPALSVRVE